MDEPRGVPPQTHLAINRALCGEPISIDEGRATVRLDASDAMRADDRGLVHGGFVFGAMDYAAMLAVNDPFVVLGSADLRFTAPVTVGDVVECTAAVTKVDGKRRFLEVNARVGDREVARGSLVAFVLPSHVLG